VIYGSDQHVGSVWLYRRAGIGAHGISDLIASRDGVLDLKEQFVMWQTGSMSNPSSSASEESES